MIQGVHAMFYSDQADELRAFLRDKLQFPYSDVGHGWLIFGVQGAEVAVHPTGDGGAASGTHDVSFFCDDLDQTIAELQSRGVEFTDEPSDRSYGRVIHFTMPGGVRVELYQPRYARPPA
jgi:predicted enzyme related to lactoylglutathione lyase